MAITRRTHGAATAWSTSQAIPYSTVAANGDVCYLIAANTAMPTGTITGWTLIASGTANGYSVAVFKKNTKYTAGDAQPTVAGGTSGGVAWIEHFYSSTAGFTIQEYDPQVALDTTTGSTAFSATGASQTSVTGDWLVGFMLLKSSATMTANASSIVLGQAGATLGTAVPNFGARLSGASPTNSLYYNSYTRPVTTGGTGTPTFTATGGSGAANVAGPAALMHIREVADSVAYDKTQDDALGATDSVALVQENARVQDDLLTLGDTVTPVQDITKTASDSLGMTDSVSAVLGMGASPSDTLGMTDSVTVVKTVGVTVNDNLGMTDSASADLVSSSPQYRASANGQVSGATVTIPITIPGTVLNNDYGVIVTIQGNGSGNPDTPAGWTLVGHYVSVGGGANMSVFRRRYQTGDANPSLFWSSAPGSGNNLSAIAFWYSNVTSDPSFGTVQAVPVAALTADAPSITTTGPDRRVVSVAAMKGGGSGFPASVAFSPNASVRATRYATGTFFGSIGVGDYVKSTAGATGAETATWDYSTVQSFAFLIEFSSQVATSYEQSPADNLGMTDWVSVALGKGANPADGLGMTDSVSIVMDRVVTINDGLGLADITGPQTIDVSYDLADALGLTDALAGTVFYVRNIADVMALSDAASGDIGNSNDQNLNDLLGLTDAVTVSGTYGRGSSDSLQMSDTIVLARGKNPADALGMTDTVTAGIGYVRTISDTLDIFDDVQIGLVMVRSIADVMGIVDSADYTTGSSTGGFYLWDGAALIHVTGGMWNGVTVEPFTGIEFTT